MKEYDTLKKFGYDVALLCWNRERKSDLGDYHLKIQPLNLKGPYGIKSLILLPIWNLFVLYKLMVCEYDIIHVINFDSYLPSLIASKIRRKVVIYEIEDTYEDQIKLPTIIRIFSLGFDKFFLKFADGIILVDECQINEFKGLGHPNIQIVYDSPPDMSRKFQQKMTDKKTFTIFYPGVLDKARMLNLNLIIQLVEKMDSVHLIISGYGDQVEDIKNKSATMPEKMKYIGWIPDRQEMFNMMHDADITFALKDPSVPLNRYICGSKLFEAMMCSIPIIVNKNSSAALKVKKHNCGIVVDANDQFEIELALIMFIKNPALREQLGNNGRRTYETIYDWDFMEERIQHVYKNAL
ncbi:MAG: glycosyltransferase family 4 protein [Methanoregula sp.]|jgi:glycosyltransferase involved in cell wall biosynthesis|uniref:glycosyltransferase family 4 protein n=1 Tax=Methanoregula sp. TaxID=2052170 RepID=UPI003C27B5B7